MDRYLDMIEDLTEWLNGTRAAFEQSGGNDAIVRYACKEGARRLNGILEQINTGDKIRWINPGWSDIDQADMEQDQEGGADE